MKPLRIVLSGLLLVMGVLVAVPLSGHGAPWDLAAAHKSSRNASGRPVPTTSTAPTTGSTVASGPASTSSATSSPRTTTAAPTTTSTQPSGSTTPAAPTSGAAGVQNTAPPQANGYFATAPAGSWSTLPSDSQCAQKVVRSSWEPRPENAQQNRTMPNAQAVHDSLAARPRGSSYDPKWDQWLMPRVDGQFTGTTDEIIQWAACKWGISDNLLRAQAVQESTWYQGLHFADGQCYWDRGCGDAFASATQNSTTYCNELARFGHDYQRDTNSATGAYPYAPRAGLCPQTFSIMGIKSWEDPAWQAPGAPYAGNQNGTFPFNRDSTAFALDYQASYLRGCYEGWVSWLGPAGDIDGCVGSWYSGDWHSPAADSYTAGVKTELANRTWLTADFANGSGNQYQCDRVKGCPQ